MERFKPQLALERSLDALPALMLPSGYGVRYFKNGDGASWNEIIRDSFQNPKSDFDRQMATDSAFIPKRVWFVCHFGTPVGTASAWFFPKFGEQTGYLHMVGVKSAYAGKGLGYAISLAAMVHMVDEGRSVVMLNTDDFRIPAIKTYLKLGFAPVIVHENHKQRWIDVFHAIGQPDLIDTFKDRINGPVKTR